MMLIKNVMLCTLLLLISSYHSGQNPDIVQEGAVIEKLAGDFKFTEGPASDSEGNVFFTDQPNDRIMKWGIDDKLTTWMQPSGRSNGLCFDQKGNLWACADERNELWIIGKNKEVQVILDNYKNNKLNGPNDIWVLADGSAFFLIHFTSVPGGIEILPNRTDNVYIIYLQIKVS